MSSSGIVTLVKLIQSLKTPSPISVIPSIPEGVTKIGWDAFSGCSNLTSVTIPEGLIEMEGAAFENCSSLTSRKGYFQ